MENMGKQLIMTTHEVAEYLQVTPAWVCQACRENRLPHFKVGNQYRIRKSDLDITYAGATW
jgi:excisionase family DNA binding protein